MRNFVFPALLAAAAAFLPSQVHASHLSEALHQARGDYNDGPGYYGSPAYGYSRGYYSPPVYSGYSPSYYYAPGVSYYSPDVYSPPVYYSTPRYYVAPSYSSSPYGYGGYQSYYPSYRDEWRGGDRDRHEWREHEEHEHHEHHEHYEHHRR